MQHPETWPTPTLDAIVQHLDHIEKSIDSDSEKKAQKPEKKQQYYSVKAGKLWNEQVQ